LTAGSTFLSQTYSYYDTGNVNVFTDVNSGQTTYAYGSGTSCGNSFPTGLTEAVTSLTRSYAWNCTGAVMTSSTDENSQVWHAGYTDPNYWRPTSTTDPASATTDLYYYTGPFATESTLNFNGSTSTVDARTTLDGLGRTHVAQRRQTQGGSNYDSVETDYNAVGLPYQVSVPYTGTAGQTGGAYHTTATYDALGRPLTVTDGGGGATTYNYTQTPGSSPVGFDVLATVSGSPNVVRQYEYDGLGRVTSVCEVNSGSGSGTCSQSVQPIGFWTKYTYDVLNDLLTVKQNAQSGTYQTRTYAYDGLGRMTSEQNPETNGSAYSYTFDTDTTCGTHDGDLVKRIDPQGTVTCYAYDALHRLTSITYPSGGYYSVTPAKYYVYDSATVDMTAMSYVKSRLAEAYTGSSKTTDLGFSYTNRGEVAGVYQSSPHSGGYYHIAATYWAPQGLFDTLNPNMTGMPSWTYNPEGEGRVNTVSASSGQNPVTGTSYNGFSDATGITFGSSDSDAFQYDPKTGRMTQYKANVGSSAMTGTPTWNANWTLGSLAITDNLNSADTQTCTYGYDGLSRLTSAGCGSVWSQSFTYDAFGNISKSGSQSFGPTYSATTNRYTAIGSVTPTYDSNGNLTYDGYHHYTWDGEGNVASLDSNGETYDALNRRVEQYNGSAYTEIVYGPAGNKLALMSGQTVTKVFTPLSAGATAVYTSTGLSYYRHPDWLGSSRVASTTSRTVYYDGAYAPFGENYAETGTTDRNFTGQNQDLTPGSAGDLYDFLYREYHKIQGRWISPDPAGLAAVNPANPQSWNRYAYVLNNPLALTDIAGLDCIYAKDDGSLESIDQQIDSDGCAADGGYWVEGTIIGYGIDNNGNYVFTSLVGPSNNLSVIMTTYLADPNGGSFSTFDLVGTYNFLLQQQQFAGQTNPLQQSGSAQAATKAIANAMANFPTLCGGGAFGYAGREYTLAPGVTLFTGQITEWDADKGTSTGGLVELNAGEGAQGGMGRIYGSNGQVTNLFFGGAGVKTPVAGASLGGVAFPGPGIGLYAEGSLGPFAAGGGAYSNITSVGNCH
jgi:RHS repeat-associated protein